MDLPRWIRRVQWEKLKTVRNAGAMRFRSSTAFEMKKLKKRNCVTSVGRVITTGTRKWKTEGKEVSDDKKNFMEISLIPGWKLLSTRSTVSAL